MPVTVIGLVAGTVAPLDTLKLVTLAPATVLTVPPVTARLAMALLLPRVNWPPVTVALLTDARDPIVVMPPLARVETLPGLMRDDGGPEIWPR